MSNVSEKKKNIIIACKFSEDSGILRKFFLKIKISEFYLRTCYAKPEKLYEALYKKNYPKLIVFASTKSQTNKKIGFRKR